MVLPGRSFCFTVSGSSLEVEGSPLQAQNPPRSAQQREFMGEMVALETFSGLLSQGAPICYLANGQRQWLYPLVTDDYLVNS